MELRSFTPLFSFSKKKKNLLQEYNEIKLKPRTKKGGREVERRGEIKAKNPKRLTFDDV